MRALLSGNCGDSAVRPACLPIEVAGLELQVECLPCRAVQPSCLLLLAGHDLKEHSYSG